MLKGFTIRVYGIMMDDEKGVLLSDEKENGMRFTKFPGGGLELGEGIRDCLLREWKEELKQEIEITEHFYTTDFFQQSAFDESKQVISVYYLVNPKNNFGVKISSTPFDFDDSLDEVQSFRWMRLSEFDESTLTFDIDRAVARIIAEMHG